MIDFVKLKTLFARANDVNEPTSVGNELAVMLLENADELISKAEDRDGAVAKVEKYEKYLKQKRDERASNKLDVAYIRLNELLAPE